MTDEDDDITRPEIPTEMSRVIMPIIRRVVPDMVAREITGVQPMDGPMSREEIEATIAEAAEAFDKWNWETGDEEDFKKFEELQEKARKAKILRDLIDNMFTSYQADAEE